jgi:glycosyltransferase involved in cell wall biosynthesis
VKSLVRQSAYRIAQRTPASIRRLIGPMVNRLLNRLLGSRPDPVGTTTGAYQVRPHRRPAERGPRVLHVIGNFMTGGSSRLVVDLYEALGHRYVQRVVTQYVPAEPAYLGIPVTEIRERDSHEPMLALIREFGPELIHVHYWGDCDTPWYETAFKAAKVAGVRVIENVNTPVAPFVSEQVREYVYVSDYVRQTFGNHGKAAERTIYPGSDFRLFRPALFATGTGSRVGMVYRLEPDKLNSEGIEPLIAAARLDADIRFMVVGGGTFLEEYRGRVRAAGFEARFDFPGYVPYDALPHYYRDLAIFVAPVWKESFGQVSPFAMNMGIPVVGYDVGAIAEIVDDRSLLAPPGDSAALGRIIVDLMHDPARRGAVGVRNRARAQELFSVQAMTSAYDRLYRAHLQRAA